MDLRFNYRMINWVACEPGTFCASHGRQKLPRTYVTCTVTNLASFAPHRAADLTGLHRLALFVLVPNSRP